MKRIVFFGFVFFLLMPFENVEASWWDWWKKGETSTISQDSNEDVPVLEKEDVSPPSIFSNQESKESERPVPLIPPEAKASPVTSFITISFGLGVDPKAIANFITAVIEQEQDTAINLPISVGGSIDYGISYKTCFDLCRISALVGFGAASAIVLSQGRGEVAILLNYPPIALSAGGGGELALLAGPFSMGPFIDFGYVGAYTRLPDDISDVLGRHLIIHGFSVGGGMLLTFYNLILKVGSDLSVINGITIPGGLAVSLGLRFAF